jgi:hypothetical protein
MTPPIIITPMIKYKMIGVSPMIVDWVCAAGETLATCNVTFEECIVDPLWPLIVTV